MHATASRLISMPCVKDVLKFLQDRGNKCSEDLKNVSLALPRKRCSKAKEHLEMNPGYPCNCRVRGSRAQWMWQIHCWHFKYFKYQQNSPLISTAKSEQLPLVDMFRIPSARLEDWNYAHFLDGLRSHAATALAAPALSWWGSRRAAGHSCPATLRLAGFVWGLMALRAPWCWSVEIKVTAFGDGFIRGNCWLNI